MQFVKQIFRRIYLNIFRTDTELRLQVCAINCLPGFESALDAPRLTCNISSTAQYPEWLPIMDDKICQKPIIGKTTMKI